MGGQLGPDLVIPLAGMLTGIVAMGALSWGMVRMFQGPVGQALGRRISGRQDQDPELMHEVLELRHQVEQLQQRLIETEERVDFSERLLAGRAEPPVEGRTA